MHGLIVRSNMLQDTLIPIKSNFGKALYQTVTTCTLIDSSFRCACASVVVVDFALAKVEIIV